MKPCEVCSEIAQALVELGARLGLIAAVRVDAREQHQAHQLIAPRTDFAGKCKSMRQVAVRLIEPAVRNEHQTGDLLVHGLCQPMPQFARHHARSRQTFQRGIAVAKPRVDDGEHGVVHDRKARQSLLLADRDTPGERVMGGAHRPAGVVGVAQAAPCLRLAFEIARALREFERPFVFRATGKPIALREIQVAALGMDARAFPVEAAARGHFLRAVQCRERRLHGARHAMRGGNADIRGAALRVVAGQRQCALERSDRFRRVADVAAQLAFELRERMANRTGCIEFAATPQQAQGGVDAQRGRLGARRRQVRARPRADRRRGRDARHAASRPARHTSPPRAGEVRADRCAAPMRTRHRGSMHG